MALPRKLKHLNLFNDGNNWQGIVESLTLPKFTRKFEKYRGGGMPGAVDVDMGLDDGALDTEFSIGGTELLLFRQMGKATVDGIQLRFTGSIQRDDTGEVQAVELVVRGRHKEVDSGEWKTGESSSTKVSSTNSYAKLTINGEVLYEVDLVNMVEIVDGILPAKSRGSLTSANAKPGLKRGVISVIKGDMNHDDGAGVICLHAAYSAVSGAAVSAKLATRSQQPGEPATINAVSWPG